jgi:hypothetical protein
MLRVAVSGSFHRHMEAISSAVRELASLGVRVLSPADPRIVAAQGEFLFVASDRVRSVRLVQDRHLESIRVANFLWLICPDGYVGLSASMEIGYAAGARVPIFGTRAPNDLTLREYVTIVPTLSEAISRASAASQRKPGEGLLIDPHASVAEAHDILERVEKVLTSECGFGERAHRELADLERRITLPT